MLLHIIILLSYHHHYYCILPLRLLLITLKHSNVVIIMVVVVVVLLLLLFISLVRYFYIFGLRHVDESKFGTPTWEGFQSLHTKISAVSAVVFRRVLLLTLTHIHIQRGPSIIGFFPFRR